MYLQFSFILLYFILKYIKIKIWGFFYIIFYVYHKLKLKIVINNIKIVMILYIQKMYRNQNKTILCNIKHCLKKRILYLWKKICLSSLKIEFMVTLYHYKKNRWDTPVLFDRLYFVFIRNRIVFWLSSSQINRMILSYFYKRW